ncbi:phage structural protein [Sporosarcina contaminans]|uniref:Phage structural protein n=1 Tax=Sporosarcina contaminans TaxID=633403 RepID=A0ABW3U4X6_9BACL
MANPKTTTYDFKKVSVVVDGVIITGFMDGESIQTEKNEDDVNVHVGADGGVTFSETNDDTGTITLTIKQTSPSDPYLRQLRASKRIFPVQIIDSNSNTFRAGGSECRIVKSPSRSYGNEVSGLEWQIAVADFKEV